MDYAKESLRLHREWKGKVGVVSKVKLENKEDLSVMESLKTYLEDTNLYEAKLVYHTPTFDDKVRTFCSNPSGEVASEYYENGKLIRTSK